MTVPKTIQTLQSEKDAIERELQALLKNSPDVLRMRDLRKRKSAITRHVAMLRFRELAKKCADGAPKKTEP